MAMGTSTSPADTDCDDASDFSEGAPVLECDDGLDNDADGAIDEDDFGCHGRGDFSERTAPNVIACDDGIDNDGDGTIDFLGDAGCGSPVQTEENPACNDGIDNDGDGLIDFDGGDSLDLDRDGFVDPAVQFSRARGDRPRPLLQHGLHQPRRGGRANADTDTDADTDADADADTDAEAGLGLGLGKALPPTLAERVPLALQPVESGLRARLG